ncbi:MAG: SGNH/GDSL hydrolase family protein [Candidatus Heimdallarchaeota archaeon]|nr:SGNH/GDSL hydrolase family protein [Candidatus Heimdallarchaeota archaeon]
MRLVFAILLITFLSILGIILLFALFIMFNFINVFQQPKNSPRKFLQKRKNLQSHKKRIVFLGDSLTQGNMSVNFIKMVKKKLGIQNFSYINAGANSELTFHVLQRIEEIIKCQPDYIIILIGTNDANRELRSRNMKFPIKYTKLPQSPTFEWFSENLEEIITLLLEETNAIIGLCSLPPLGEDLNHQANIQCQKYSDEIKRKTKEFNINYLPVFEKSIEFLEKNPSRAKYSFEHRLIEYAFIKHRIFRYKLDKISEQYGFSITTDHVHLNSKGAKIVANLIIEFIKNN